MGLKLGMSANERKAAAGGDDAPQVHPGLRMATPTPIPPPYPYPYAYPYPYLLTLIPTLQVQSGAPQMRNVTIDELWAEARQLVESAALLRRLAVVPQRTTLAPALPPSRPPALPPSSPLALAAPGCATHARRAAQCPNERQRRAREARPSWSIPPPSIPQAQQEKVTPAEYRAFIRARLVQPSAPLAHKLPVAEEVMGRLTQLGGEIGGGLRTLGEGLGNGVVFERVANALKDMAHPAIDGGRALAPGGDAGKSK